MAIDISSLDPEVFDTSLEPHVLTDKDVTKTVPCTECRRACVVTTFMAPAKVRCREHKSGRTTERSVGSVAVVQPGRTDPSVAANLADCLINKAFAHAICPHGADHRMELKDVCHVPNYGPRHLEGYDKGVPKYKQETGELVLHQCLDCATVVQYSTTNPRQLRRVNEPRTSGRSTPDSTELILGVRDES